ncbi:MAG TPA: endonuclease domain-containing protein [Spirochaetota bacterium]|nr:endonuclease domain-containing protein [Spirochaetota bacterium]
MSEKSIARNQRVSSVKVERSRELRKDMTEAEKVFWEMVRDRRMFGLKFRRQQIIDGFIVDFYCDSLGLCVEIDGGVHETEEQKNYDKLRDEALAIRSLKILRLKNEEVLGDKDLVIEKIAGYKL